MLTVTRFGRRNWLFLGLLTVALLVPGGSPGARESSGARAKIAGSDPNGGPGRELSPLMLLKLDRNRPTLFARPSDLRVGRRLGPALTDEQRANPRALILHSGAFLTDSQPIHAQIPDELRQRGLAGPDDARSLRAAPARFKPDMYLVQLDREAWSRGRVLEEIEGLGAKIARPVPHYAVLAKIDSFALLQKVADHAGVVHVERYHAALKASALLGHEAYASRAAAEKRSFDLDVELFEEGLFPEHRGQSFRRFAEETLKAEYAYEHPEVGRGGLARVILRDVDPGRLDQLAQHPRVYRFGSVQGYFPLTTTSPAVVQAGHYLNNLSPFFGLGIDGSSQVVAVSDDGVSLDSMPFAHSRTQPDLNPANDGDPLIRPDVGPAHRKVESYRTVAEINTSVGRTGTSIGAGDFRTCDSPLQGSSTHGQMVSALAVGNPSAGPNGLGIFRDNIFVNFGFFQRDIPFDGVARGARLIFQDGHNTPTTQVACFSFGDTNVNPGTGTVAVGGLTFGVVRALLHDAAFRLLDRSVDPRVTANWVPQANGARVHILPFGVPNFDTNLTNGHDAYNADTNDIDDFLYRNRESLVVLAAGNDGSDRTESIGLGGLEVFPDPANDATYQIATPATAKNGLVVGSHTQDGTVFSIADDVENPSDFTSKGPATFDSKRVAPLLMAPGTDGANDDFSSQNFGSIVSFRSNDNDQAGPIATLTDHDGNPTDFLDEYNVGTSFAAAAAGGAAALVRDYFIKGFYPRGSQDPAQAKPTLSGALVKAVLIAGANYEDLDLKLESGTVASLDRFSNVQGYGRIQLVNALPLSTYPEALLPEPKLAAEVPGANPTTPLGVLAIDEYFDGGQGLGVIAHGITNNYTLNVIDGSRELRVALAWADVPGELLVHDLDLTLVAPATADTDGLPATPPATLTFNGNQFLTDFSVDTRISSGTAFRQACDPTVIGRDKCNPTEAVILSPGQFVNEDVGLRAGIQGAGDQTPICTTLLPCTTRNFLNIGPTADGNDFRVTFLGEADGVLNAEPSGGLNTAICSAYQATNTDVAAICATSRDLNGDGLRIGTEDENGNSRLDTQSGVPVGAWQVQVFARNAVTTAATQVRNAPATVSGRVADAANSPATLFAYPLSVRPFALLAAGGFLPAGTSRAALDRSIYDCSDTARARVIDTATGASAGSVAAATTLEVVRAGSVVDTEAGLSFTAMGSIAGAFESRPLPVNRGTVAISSNGVLDVDSGDIVRIRYSGSGGSTGQSAVDCAPSIIAAPLPLFGPDQTALVAGGCDNDRFFDAGEMIAYSINMQNIRQDTQIHEDLLVSLTCTNPPGTESANPCQHIQILNSPVRVGTLPTSVGPESNVLLGHSPTFNIFVKPTVRSVPEASRLIDMSITVQSATQDLKVTRQEPVVLTFRHALESDVEVFHYSTDYPDGSSGFVLRDLDRDGTIRPVLNPRLSEPGIGQILSITDARGLFAISELAQETQRFSPIYATEQFGTRQHNVRDVTITGEGPGLEIFDPPFDFDSAGDPASEGFFPIRSPLSRPGTTGLPPVAWFHTQSGVCGFQTQQSGRAGVWHAGGNPTGLTFDQTCPNYGLPGAADGIDGNQFINDALLLPVLSKVNQARDPRGFDFTARLTRFAWNEQMGFPSDAVYLMGHIDNNLDLDGNIDLINAGIYGELGIYQFYQPGPITSTNDLSQNAALQLTFGPLHDPDRSTRIVPTAQVKPSLTGDEVGVANHLVGATTITGLPEADTLISRFLLPFPARDADTATAAFDRGLQDRSTQAGPVRNRETSFLSFSVVPAFEDVWGPTGNRFQAALTWFIAEDPENTQTGYGWTIDDLLLEWDESHPKAQAANSGTSCERIGFTEDANGNGTLDAGEDTGLDGVAGTGDFGEGDGLITTNGAGAQCASLVVDRQNLYDCNTTLDVTVQDLTPPDVFNATTNTFCRDSVTGRFDSPCDGQPDGFVVVNARTFSEPRGEEFTLKAVAGNPNLFRGQVPVSTVLNANDPALTNLGNVFIRPSSDIGVSPFPLVITYQDLDCDGDSDGTLEEDNFRDIDGDGVTNFDNDFDSFPDDNCFINGTDVFNPDQENDAFGQIRDALKLCTADAQCTTGTGDACVCPGGLTQCVQRVCRNPIRTGLLVREFFDVDNSLSYTPTEDAVLGPGHPSSFNGVLDPGEDLGNNGLPDSAEPLLGPDGAPGRAGLDDDKKNGVDDAGETGWCGTDDRLGDNFRAVANPALGFPNACPPPAGGEGSGTLEGDVIGQGDRFGDLCDNCPLFFNPTQIDDDADGVGNECEDNDLDKDGVPNVPDNCDTVFNPFSLSGVQADGDGDGRGDACDQTTGPASNPDGDELVNALDNCPLKKNTACNSTDPAVNLARCDADGDGVLSDKEIREGFQRDTDFDGIGDACDPEDIDIDLATGQLRPDGVPNFQDNCPTIYNPRNAEGVQEDTDGDGKGDSRATSGFAACDPDSTDDNDDGTPDDLVGFGLTVSCNTRIAGNLGAVLVSSLTVDDCNPPAEGDCDGFADPGEHILVRAGITNGLTTPIHNVRVGLGTTSDSIACLLVGEADYGTIDAGASSTGSTPFEFVVTTGEASQLNPLLPVSVVLREPKRAVFTVTVRANEVAGPLATQTFALNHDLDVLAGSGQIPFGYFESFENALENTPADPRDCNNNDIIDCGPDNDCTTVTPCRQTSDPPTTLCTINTLSCDEWDQPLAADPDLRLINETRTGNTFPESRGRAEIVSPGSRLICPADLDNGSPINGIRPDSLDWHVHTSKSGEIIGTDTSAQGDQPKARRGLNSLHWGRHVAVPRQRNTFGDTYCLQCMNAFLMSDAGFNMNNVIVPGQPLRLSFWHINEACDQECYFGFGGHVADDGVSIVEVRADLDFGAGTTYAPWERIEGNINPYDGQQDTAYFTATYEPPDDSNPLSQVDRETTMCSPLFSFIGVGSAKGTDAVNCTDGDGNGFLDCGWIGARTNPAERRPDRISRGEAGVGVWAFSSFDLDRYAGRHIQVRFITTTLDGRDLFTSYLETTSGPFNAPSISTDDGWYIDDVRISGIVPNELLIDIDRDDSTAQCPAAGSLACSISGAGLTADPAVTNAPGTTVRLTAAGIAVNCLGGETQYRWLRNGVEVQPFSTDNTLVDSPRVDTTYSVEVRCSLQIPGCSTSATTTVRVYDGATSESIVLRWRLGSDPTLYYTPVYQASLTGPGGSGTAGPGFDVFCGLVRPGTPPTSCSGAGLAATSAGSGVASNYGSCFAPDMGPGGVCVIGTTCTTDSNCTDICTDQGLCLYGGTACTTNANCTGIGACDESFPGTPDRCIFNGATCNTDGDCTQGFCSASNALCANESDCPGTENQCVKCAIALRTPNPPSPGSALFWVAGHAVPTPELLGFTSNNILRKASVSCP